MEAYLKDALAAARAALANADLDELLQDFLEFEEHATGPTVEEMFGALNTPTHVIMGLKEHNVEDDDIVIVSEQPRYLSDDFSVAREISNYEYTLCEISILQQVYPNLHNGRCANDDRFSGLIPSKLSVKDAFFLLDDDSFALAS